MVWSLGDSDWGIIAGVCAALALVGVARPWRLWRSRTYCPQCNKLLRRWGRWGWKDDWTCPQCGCQVSR